MKYKKGHLMGIFFWVASFLPLQANPSERINEGEKEDESLPVAKDKANFFLPTTLSIMGILAGIIYYNGAKKRKHKLSIKKIKKKEKKKAYRTNKKEVNIFLNKVRNGGKKNKNYFKNNHLDPIYQPKKEEIDEKDTHNKNCPSDPLRENKWHSKDFIVDRKKALFKNFPKNPGIYLSYRDGDNKEKIEYLGAVDASIKKNNGFFNVKEEVDKKPRKEVQVIFSDNTQIFCVEYKIQNLSKIDIIIQPKESDAVPLFNYSKAEKGGKFKEFKVKGVPSGDFNLFSRSTP